MTLLGYCLSGGRQAPAIIQILLKSGAKTSDLAPALSLSFYRMLDFPDEAIGIMASTNFVISLLDQQDRNEQLYQAFHAKIEMCDDTFFERTFLDLIGCYCSSGLACELIDAVTNNSPEKIFESNLKEFNILFRYLILACKAKKDTQDLNKLEKAFSKLQNHAHEVLTKNSTARLDRAKKVKNLSSELKKLVAQ